MSEEIELPELEEEVPGATKKPPMTSEEKQDAVELFGEGISIADIARKYDRTAQHFSQMFRAMNLTRGEVRRIRKEAEAAAANAVAAARASSFAEQRLQRIEEWKGFANQGFRIMGQRAVMKFRESATALANKVTDPLSEKEAMLLARQFQIANTGMRENLAMDDHIATDELPEIVIRDLSDEEIINLQQGKAMDFDPLAPLDADDDVVVE
jgi:transposase-like protein